MSVALGIHDHPQMKLGKRPAMHKPSLMLRDVLTGAVPDHPPAADYLRNLEFDLGRNDEFGVCGPVYLANYRRLTTAMLTGTMQPPTQDDIFDLYRRSGNPDFDPATGAGDRGVYMQEMLEAAHDGGIGGVRLVAFAKVNVDDRETMRAALGIFGGLGYGLDLQNVQKTQTGTGTWDWTPGSGEWGGHAVLGGQYDPDSIGGISWRLRVDMTDSFISYQADEAWVAIWPEHLSDRTFLAGVDVAKLANAYHAVTGGDLPVPPVPQPPEEQAMWAPTAVQKVALQRAGARHRPPLDWRQETDKIVNGSLHIRER